MRLHILLVIFFLLVVNCFVIADSFTQDYSAVTDGINRFGFNVNRLLLDTHTTNNIIFSPYSMANALGMTLAGAYGNTASEIEDVLGFSKDKGSEVGGTLNPLLEFSHDAGIRLNIANSVWVHKQFKILKEYESKVENEYLAEAFRINFKNTKSARKKINKWVTHKTENMIEELLREGDITSAVRMVLINAMYFKGTWEYQFDPSMTTKQDFFVGPKDIARVDTMHIETAVDYYADDKFQAVSLNYNDQKASMVIFVPASSEMLSVEKFNYQYYKDVLRKMENQNVTIYLPRFSIRFHNSMRQLLGKLGMRTAFLAANADFSGITGKRDLAISEVIHEACLDVNEEGAQASAATSVVMTRGQVEKPLIFRANQPFIIIIREHTSGQILFMGRISDPR